jgi:hypothetical protein
MFVEDLKESALIICREWIYQNPKNIKFIIESRSEDDIIDKQDIKELIELSVFLMK